MKAFSSSCGDIADYKVTTGADGYARFSYRSPSPLPLSCDTPLEIEFDNNGTIITQEIEIEFNPSTDNSDESNYAFLNVKTPIEITHVNQVEIISAYIVEKDTGVGIAGKTVTLSTPSHGELASSTAVSNDAGKVEFSYTAPDDLSSINNTSSSVTLRFTEDGITISSDISIDFNQSAITSDYNLTNANGITVSYAGELKEIAVQLVKDGTPQEGKEIVAKSIPVAYGTIADATVTTGSDGYARFTYVAASPLEDANTSLELVFTDDNGVVVATTVDINISEEAKAFDYNLTNETDVLITRENQVEVLSIYLVDSETGVGVSGKVVSISTLDLGYGEFASATATTDASGKAEFSYTAPDDLTDIDQTEINATMSFEEDGVRIAKMVTFKFDKAILTSDYNLTNANGITVSYAGELKEIAVQLVKDGTPQEGKEIVAKSIPVAYGTIADATVTTGSDGYARFTYVAASPLEDANTSLELVFTDDNGVVVATTVTIDIEEKPLPLPNVVIPNDREENNLTVNNELVELAIKVYDENNAPYSEGKVNVVLPDKVIDGVDVGSFEAYSVDIVEGVATFKYKGPSDLQSLVDNNDTNSTFFFYHEANSEAKKPVVMLYDPTTDKYVPQNYTLTVSSKDGEMTMGLDATKSFSAILKDDQGNDVPDENITSFTITSKNTFVGQLLDADNNKVDSLTIEGKHSVNFTIDTDTKSGLLPLDIVVKFVDPNGEEQERSVTINLVVFSGPATAMSISYVGVSQDEDAGKYVEKFAVTVTDAYNNPVNTQPYIAVGGMVEYAVDGSSADGNRTTTSPRLWYGREDSHATLNADDKTLTVEDGTDTFNYVDFDNDKLVLFGAGYVYEALGKWDITEENSTTLNLSDDYNGSTREGLYFAVGHNNRQDLCADDGREYIGNMVSTTYQINAQGTAFVEFEYDYHLTGKDVMVWVNLTGYQADSNSSTTRIGEVRSHTLRGNGLISEDSYLVDNNATVHFNIKHLNAAEWYRNGHFAFRAEGTCTVEGEPIDWSNYHDARDCGNDAIAYVDLNVTNDTTSDQCTISIADIVVSDEF
jgi:hypothetical protein